MKFKEIQEIIRLANRLKLNELQIEKKDFKIHLRTKYDTSKKKGKAAQATQQVPVVQPQPAAQPAAPPQQQAAQPQGGGGGQQQQNKQPAQQEDKKKEEEQEDSNLITVQSPMIGTFYRRPNPDKDAFVKVGDQVKKGDTLCIIEAMKLFNEIESEHEGKIKKILVDDASPVEYDQPLFLIDPEG